LFGEGRGNIVRQQRINERIRAKEVRLIGESGEQRGIMPLRQALQIARESNLDLVEVASNAVPPVCRLLDYGRYKYEQTKKERKARKGQKAALLREMRVRPKISEHDLEAKIRLIRKLMDEGDKVKISILFRGRENTHPETGQKVLQRIVAALQGTATIEGSLGIGGTAMHLILSPASAGKGKELAAAKEIQNAKA